MTEKHWKIYIAIQGKINIEIRYESLEEISLDLFCEELKFQGNKLIQRYAIYRKIEMSVEGINVSRILNISDRKWSIDVRYNAKNECKYLTKVRDIYYAG